VTGGETRHADIPNDLAQLDALATVQLRSKSRQMSVDRHHARAVLQFDDVAKTARAPHETHAAFAGGANRGAHRSGVIDAAMRANGVEYRVAARGVESRTDARKLDRSANESLAQAPALGSEVFAVAIFIDVTDGADFAPTVHALGGQDVSAAKAHIILKYFRRRP
jgi:hypothetical protein